MTDEEKEALRNLKSEYETCDHYSSDLIIELDDAEIILNLIEKQDKVINLLVQQVVFYSEKFDNKFKYENEVKKYFIKKVEV